MAVFRLSVALATMYLLTGSCAFALGDWTKDPAEQDKRLQHLQVRLPSCVDDSTSIRLERLGQSIDVCRSKYNYSVPRSHACDWWD